jgi:four helix bundle protein
VILNGGHVAAAAGMSTINSFRELILWQISMDLAVQCYSLARKFPRVEQEVLGYQIRKSAVSLPSNIAEGFSRHSTAFYVQHLWTAHGSGAELETQIALGRRLFLVAETDANVLTARAQEVGRMINGLVQSLERSRKAGR